MASIQFTLSPTSSIRSSPSFAGSPANPITSQYSSTSTKDLSSCCKLSSRQKNVIKRNGSRNLVSTVRSSLDTAGPTSAVGQVTEVTKDTFWAIVNSAGDKTVVLDMYTQWCGPCKLIAPKYKEFIPEPLAKELGIKVVPTFKILKHGKIVKEVTGAKFDNLVIAIEGVRSAS
ncbi:hypothetical protein NC653_041279 [Populus alba x Populus x berolinensis]|uniref:Thioredoxin domain-containing protein n=1 Tax=Populus alba x Populus x berolinensis TaxID=444605 RepID=A0AAD6L847_9ROSI|nr:hypothetical protein NC653_041279 [Populus alba x Populus x berolinensis]